MTDLARLRIGYRRPGDLNRIAPPRRAEPIRLADDVARELRQRTGANYEEPTGTLSRATFDPSTVTLEQLAQRVAALQRDKKREGLG